MPRVETLTIVIPIWRMRIAVFIVWIVANAADLLGVEHNHNRLVERLARWAVAGAKIKR